MMHPHSPQACQPMVMTAGNHGNVQDNSYPPSPGVHRAGLLSSSSKPIQTDLTCLQLQNMEAKSAADLSKKDTVITELERQNEEIRRQLTAQNKLIDKHKETIQKCISFTKTLLIDKSKLVKKTARQKCMENRLRLGQFVTQRQGASFVENWSDGHAFTDLIKQQENIAREREDIERQRKNLQKRKLQSLFRGQNHPKK